MARRLIIGAVLVGIGLFIGLYVGADHAGNTDSAPVVSTGPGAALDGGGERVTSLGARRDSLPFRRDHRLDAIAAALESETAAREQIEQRLNEMAEELATLRANVQEEPAAAAKSSGDTKTVVSSAAPQPAHSAQGSSPVESAAAESGEGLSPTQRALITAGVDPSVADRVKRQDDAKELAKIYLRDQAVREGWVDSPRFGEEMQDLNAQYPALRDEIGDDAYDRYLAALGRPNRVRVEDVMLESPAAQAGLQAGDLVLRYGDARIFAPDDLVSETQGGLAGETIRVEVLRQGQRIAINVARGPLGIRIAATQGAPEEG